jgi:hypothetical protein
MQYKLALAFAAIAAVAFFVVPGCDCSDAVDPIKGGDGGHADRPLYEIDVGTQDGGPRDTGGGDEETDAGPPPCGDTVCKKNEVCRCGLCKPKYCVEDSECNPGQICVGKTCKDSFLNCSGSKCDDKPEGCTCEIEEQKCSATEGKSSCHYEKCDAGGKCPEGMSCFNTFCVVGLPCNGKCLDSQVCLTDRNECIPAPEACASVKCGEGQLRVFKDPEKSTYEACEKIECSCEFFPDIAIGEYALYPSFALKGGEAYAAAYNRTYGDLMVTKFEAAVDDMAGVDTSTAEFVDGVPAQGSITGNPKGPRGGTTDPGPDVGKYTSAAFGGDGNLAVAYYDVTNGDLKFARHDGTKWAAHVVDGADGSDVGTYAALTFAQDGKPHIAYFQKTGAPGGEFLVAGLKLAIGKSQSPSSPSDWDILYVEKTPITCRGLCAKTDACIEQAPLSTCVKVESDCDPACTDQKCIHDAGGAPVCVDELVNAAPELNEGTGQFPSIIAASDGNDYIAFYDFSPPDVDTFKGNLKMAVVSGGTATVSIVDGEDAQGADTGDVGRFASLAQSGNGEFGIAYYDARLNQLKYWHGAVGQPGAIEVVATGVVPGVKELVGPDCSLAFDSNNNPHIAYQNATTHQLVYAVRAGDQDPWPAGSSVVLMDPNDTKFSGRFGPGGYGFFTRQRIDGTTSFIINAKVGFVNPDLPTMDNRLILFKKKF